MEDNHVERSLVGVLFPGIVKNDEKALACIGGVRNLSHVYSNMNKKRLGLSFQPDNLFIKKIYANSRKSAGVLLKVKVKKTQMGKEIKREVISTAVVGTVRTMFRFESMCDFQYLPIQKEDAADASFKCILEQIIPSGLDDQTFMSEPAPLFLTPPSFTRFEKPIRYTYTEKRYLTRAEHSARSLPEHGEGESVHSKIRTLRSSNAAPYAFNLTDELPSEPTEGAMQLKSFKEEINPTIAQDYERLKQFFIERPIWSLNLLKFRTKIKGSTFKVLMPCLAIYHKTGPWRMLWVRFGYDPRKDPEARIYQTLDFRLRHGQGIRSLILTRDELGVKGVKQSSRRTCNADSEDVVESSVCFGPETVPTQRHIFYQYCDVKIPEVQDILAVPPPPGHLCHEKRGWLPAGADEQARDHMFRYVRNNLLSSTSADLTRLEEGGVSDSDDTNSDDDTRLSDVDQTEEPTDDA